MILAEREGFEPSLEFPLNTLSKRAPSTTRPSLQPFYVTSFCYGRRLGELKLASQAEEAFVRKLNIRLAIGARIGQ